MSSATSRLVASPFLFRPEVPSKGVKVLFFFFFFFCLGHDTILFYDFFGATDFDISNLGIVGFDCFLVTYDLLFTVLVAFGLFVSWCWRVLIFDFLSKLPAKKGGTNFLLGFYLLAAVIVLSWKNASDFILHGSVIWTADIETSACGLPEMLSASFSCCSEYLWLSSFSRCRLRRGQSWSRYYTVIKGNNTSISEGRCEVFCC